MVRALKEEELLARWPGNPIARMWFRCKYRGERKVLTAEEKEARKLEYYRRRNEKRAAQRRAAGMKEHRKFATEEERHAAKLENQRRYAAKKRRERGASIRKTFATEEERKAAQSERKKKWKAEHPENVEASKRKRQEKMKRMKTEDPAAREKAREKFQEQTAALEAARAALPENGSWLRDWCGEHGMTEKEARARAGLGGATWGILWRGGKTIPPLALIVGRNLGMTPEEVAHLGIIPDRHRWEKCNDAESMEADMPEFFDLRWFDRVADYPAAEGLRILYPTRPVHVPYQRKREGFLRGGAVIEYEHRCVICGKKFVTEREGSKACSKSCIAVLMQRIQREKRQAAP